jgi:hypothetical protein
MLQNELIRETSSNFPREYFKEGGVTDDPPSVVILSFSLLLLLFLDSSPSRVHHTQLLPHLPVIGHFSPSAVVSSFQTLPIRTVQPEQSQQSQWHVAIPTTPQTFRMVLYSCFDSLLFPLTSPVV